MPTIQPTAVTGDFRGVLYEFLKTVEGLVPFVYSDGNGIPTLGVGYALATGTPGKQDWKPTRTQGVRHDFVSPDQVHAVMRAQGV